MVVWGRVVSRDGLVVVVVWCCLMSYFVLWSGIVYCDGRVMLWW